MKLLGYGDFDWEPHGFSADLPPDWMPFPGVEPVILRRPGTFATFGPSEISELNIPVTFMILPSNTMGDANTRLEEAFLYLFKRINPYNTAPRQLRGQRNNGTLISIPAVVRILPRSDERNANARFVDFVAVQPFWDAVAPVVASGTF